MEYKKPLAFFVAGTDTEIGKTLVSSALLYGMVQQGLQSIGMKPVAAGAFLQDGVWCNEDVLALKDAGNVILPAELSKLVNPYLFKLAAAPHIAAQQEMQQINLSVILDCYQQLTTYAQALIVEGVGGFRVPLNAQEDSADMAQQLNLPVVLVVGMRLGCISQALLTVEAITARGLTVAAWVANCAQGEMAHLQDNLIALQERINAPLLGCIPCLDKPTAQAAAAHLDLTKLLKLPEQLIT
ncbi:dethiobiotin synthase [Solimicrobium silvestre]|uniref:ATP-dependent dethiobiotin synthetase BioD n=1 Tax=Solimicrobium silvestre TaxID=2099400 RepID=A0A2S9H020_9BURK|nr:dethiobiotin synthase [Solimicrobium silvestre]PRC93332.1 bioD: dethiobiotin synthase [Solimicrobium silvestre]